MNTEGMHLFKLVFLFSLHIYTGVELLDHMVVLFLVFFEEPPYCFPQWLHEFAFLPKAYKVSYSLYPLQYLLFVLFLMVDILTGVR